LRTLKKKLKINFEFEKYISEISNVKHCQLAVLIQSSEFQLIDYLLKLVDIAMVHTIEEFVKKNWTLFDFV
jgi:hypothetical protein